MAIEDLRNRDWLLLPGTLCNGAAFDGFLDALGVAPARRHVIPMRHPAVEDYRQELHSAARDAVVCGFSLGAIVAAHHADRLDAARVILFALNPGPDDPAKADGRHALARAVATEGGAGAMTSRLPPLAGPDPDAARALILAMADATAHEIDAQTALAMSRPGALDALSRTRMPTFLLTGSEDSATPEALGQAAAATAPRGLYRQLPGLGHYALLEDPAACATAVIELEETLQARAQTGGGRQ